MQDRALDHALEAAGRRRIGLALDTQRFELGVEIMRHRFFQLAQIDTAGDHHLGGVGIVSQREEKMLERRIFVAAAGRLGQRLMQRGLERGGKRGHSGYSWGPAGAGHRFCPNVGDGLQFINPGILPPPSARPL